MAEPRISALVLARDEAANLPGCLESVAWADEVVVIVDRASRDQTLAIAERVADVVAVRPVRRLRQPAERRARSGVGRLGLRRRRRRAGHPRARRRDPPGRSSAPSGPGCAAGPERLPGADPERDSGPSVRVLGHAARPAAPPLPPRRRPLGRRRARDGRARGEHRPASARRSCIARSPTCRRS